MVAMANTAKAAQVARMAWTSTSVVETPAVAMAKAAKTTVWVWRPTPGLLRKSKRALMALVMLQPQLRPLRPLDMALVRVLPQLWPQTAAEGDGEPAEAMLGIEPQGISAQANQVGER